MKKQAQQPDKVVELIKKRRQGGYLLFVAEREMDEYLEFFRKKLFPTRNQLLLDWIEPETQSVELVREALRRWQNKPLGSYRIFAVKNLNNLSSHIQNLLLKSLEETKKGQIFLLFATAEEGILSTILSRCQRYHFAPRGRKETAVLELGDFRKWWEQKPSSREELRQKIFMWLTAKEGNNLGEKLLTYYLMSKKVNVNLDLFWTNLFFDLKAEDHEE